MQKYSTKYKKILKRIFDICISVILLILLSPIFILLALCIYLALGRPIIFEQIRPGLDSKLFTILKFRSMAYKIDDEGNPLHDVFRLTRFGKLLRSTSLDELPELWNVIKGEMSLVGPRPLLVEYLPLYSQHQLRRHEMKPGITGWAQINGRNELSWEERLDLDIWYIDNWSFALDLKILLITVAKVMRRDGISQSGHVTMQPFTGSSRENDIR